MTTFFAIWMGVKAVTLTSQGVRKLVEHKNRPKVMTWVEVNERWHK